MKSRVWLDSAATLPVCDAARAAAADALALAGNPASVHGEGRAARAVLERARDAVAALAGARPEQVILTSGGTEAIALALHGGALRVLASATEHSAVLGALCEIERLPVRASGLLDLNALASALAAGPALVAVQQGNNETGVVQPIPEIAAMVQAAGGRLLVDCVQSAGKMPLPEGADYLALSAHKMGGPMGAGALVMRPGAPMRAQPGGQERGHRPGTPNLPGHAGWAAALMAPAPDWAAVGALRRWLEAEMTAAGAVIHGAEAPRLPHIISAGLAGVSATTQLMHLDLAGFAVSAGAACSSGKAGPSHVLAAMGLGKAAGEAVRISLSPTTTRDELERFLAAWAQLAARRLAA